jgi:uncharacterized protein (TIGR03437 family)
MNSLGRSLLFLSFTYATWAQGLPRTNLVAFYPLNGNVNDSSGNGRNGTINGNPTFTANGPYGGKALTFNGDDMTVSSGPNGCENPQNCTIGANDYVTVPVDTSIENTPQETFGGWFLVSTSASTCCNRGLISSDDGGFDPTIDIDTRTTGGFQYGAFYGSGVASIGQQNANTGQWTFVAVSYDNVAQTYILQVGNQQTTGSLNFDGNGVEGFTFLGINPNFDYEFNGSMADVFFYNTALTANQLNAIYQGGPSVVLGTPQITSVKTSSGGSQIAQNTWIEVHGSALSTTAPRIWNGSDFTGTQMPTQLDGVSVTVNGKPAFVYFVSGSQVNVLTPLDSTTGPVQVQLKNNLGTSNTTSVSEVTDSPALILAGSTEYVVAQHSDYSLVGPAALDQPGYTFTPAHVGETVLLYGFGFGLPTAQLSNGLETQSGDLPTLPSILINGAVAQVKFAGLISPGLYQINVIIPSGATNGDNSISVSYGGFSIPSGALITVGP